MSTTQPSLELRVGELYSREELRGRGLELARFYTSFSLYTDGETGYFFRHVPLRKLKIRYELKDIIPLPINEDNEEEGEDELFNCCGPHRFVEGLEDGKKKNVKE